jgi:hypothetical protein
MTNKTTMYFKTGGWRFRWRGDSHFAVFHESQSFTTVPYDVPALPRWVTISRLDRQGFQAVCRWWVDEHAPNDH